ncbi:unnamed protein product [Macrosiphum euphorbiae]|uniref:THAP-type domain-containing protein n=1 Tax=Macrosiphum euphorbiae TaxID=13131 RepID=A0AAV0XPR3_9HEMI|nr:unnamed protein product [Macrosiphum euphorbiae]
MPVSCSAHDCTNRRQRDGSIHFFSFPLKNAERNQLWINAVGRKGFIPTKNSAICSSHFVASDFKINPGSNYRLHLNDTAVPSVFPGNTSEKKSQIEQNIEENSPIRGIIDTNNLLLTTPSKVTARRPLISPKTKSKHTSEPLTPRKIELTKKNKIVATRNKTKG